VRTGGWGKHNPFFSRGTFRDFVQKRFALRSVIATNKDILKIETDWIARSPRLRRGSLRKNPFVWRLNQTAGEARRGLFWQAGGGSGARSAQQMKFVSNFFLSAEGGIRSQFLIPHFTCPPLADGQRRLTTNL